MTWLSNVSSQGFELIEVVLRKLEKITPYTDYTFAVSRKIRTLSRIGYCYLLHAQFDLNISTNTPTVYHASRTRGTRVTKTAGDTGERDLCDWPDISTHRRPTDLGSFLPKIA